MKSQNLVAGRARRRALPSHVLSQRTRLLTTLWQAWAKDFGLPEILMMKELHQRAPMLLRNTCMQVSARTRFTDIPFRSLGDVD